LARQRPDAEGGRSVARASWAATLTNPLHTILKYSPHRPRRPVPQACRRTHPDRQRHSPRNSEAAEQAGDQTTLIFAERHVQQQSLAAENPGRHNDLARQRRREAASVARASWTATTRSFSYSNQQVAGSAPNSVLDSYCVVTLAEGITRIARGVWHLLSMAPADGAPAKLAYRCRLVPTLIAFHEHLGPSNVLALQRPFAEGGRSVARASCTAPRPSRTS